MTTQITKNELKDIIANKEKVLLIFSRATKSVLQNICFGLVWLYNDKKIIKTNIPNKNEKYPVYLGADGRYSIQSREILNDGELSEVKELI